ncbi:MAG: hypothetical protein ACLFTB_06555 [Desulfovibrionales bacterium]
MKKMIGTVVILLCTTLVFAAGEATKNQSGEQIVNEACGNCHSMDRICYNLDRERDYWIATVHRMIANGAPISTDQVEPVADFLVSVDAGSAPFCR